MRMLVASAGYFGTYLSPLTVCTRSSQTSQNSSSFYAAFPISGWIMEFAAVAVL
jgi:hypothetical protein